MKFITCQPPGVLLENDFVVHNQMQIENGDPFRECFHGQNGKHEQCLRKRNDTKEVDLQENELSMDSPAMCMHREQFWQRMTRKGHLMRVKRR